MPRISLSMAQLLRCFLLALLATDVCMVQEQPQRNLDNQGDEHKKELANLKRVVELLRAQNQQHEDKVADLTRENENVRAQNRQSETTLSKLMMSPGGPGHRAANHGYHHFYENALARFRHLPGLRLLEIGVDQGESLLLWLQYFSSLAPDGVQGLECAGPGCSHVAVRGKIADACRHRKIPGCERVRVFFGDQADEEFLRHVVANGAGLRPEDTRNDWSRGGWDLVIDDGGHIPRDQLTTFCALFPFVRPGGLYVIEDVETSYWDGPGAVAYGRPFPGAGLGKKAPGNFVEEMKLLVDVINRGWFFSPEYTVLGEHIDHSIASISFHGGLIAVQKKTVEHGVYPFQHYCEKDRARFVDLDAVQARIRSLHQVSLEERVRKTKEEEECLGDALACVWTRTRQRWKRPSSNEHAEWVLWPWPWGSPPPPDNDDSPRAGSFIVKISHGSGDMEGLLSATEGLSVPLLEPDRKTKVQEINVKVQEINVKVQEINVSNVAPRKKQLVSNVAPRKKQLETLQEKYTELINDDEWDGPLVGVLPLVGVIIDSLDCVTDPAVQLHVGLRGLVEGAEYRVLVGKKDVYSFQTKCGWVVIKAASNHALIPVNCDLPPPTDTARYSLQVWVYDASHPDDAPLAHQNALLDYRAFHEIQTLSFCDDHARRGNKSGGEQHSVHAQAGRSQSPAGQDQGRFEQFMDAVCRRCAYSGFGCGCELSEENPAFEVLRNYAAQYNAWRSSLLHNLHSPEPAWSDSVWDDIGMHACMCVCMYACLYVCICICMHVFTYVCIYLHTQTRSSPSG
jgi:hypothetical protein